MGFLWLLTTTTAFTGAPRPLTPTRVHSEPYDGISNWKPTPPPAGYDEGRVQRNSPVRIHMTIHKDGRIEQRVEGLKGEACEALTADLNAKLGDIISSVPTSERYEQPLEDTDTIYEKKYSEW